ncbi:MAG: M4 family metallopeptidase, partial [Bacteroidota bacterium]
MLLLCPYFVNGQQKTELEKLANEIDDSAWLHFMPEAKVELEGFWERHGHELGLGPDDQMILKREETDDQKIVHRRYQQHHHGIPIEDAYYSLHAKEGLVYLAQGSLGNRLPETSTPAISEAEALATGLAFLEGEIYAWEDEEWEAERRAEKGITASWYPKGELRYAFDELEDAYRLSWAFEVAMLVPFESWKVVVDAESNQALRKEPLFHACSGTDINCSTNTHYNGNQNFTGADASGSIFLRDCSRDIETKVFEGRFSFGLWVPRSWWNMTQIASNSAVWTFTDQTGSSALWAGQEAWDFFENDLGYTGWDDNGRRVRIATQYRYPNGTFSNNAFYDGLKEMVLLGVNTDVAPGLPKVTLDIVGHEYTHAITANTADFNYRRESGALDEGYADIFGFMIERSAENGQNLDWWISEDDQAFWRNMENPLLTNHPNVVWGGNYVNPTVSGCPTPSGANDWCGVHTNSSIVNKAFNLLSGSPFQQNGIVTPGIGIDAAAAIAFRALRYYLHPNAGFWNARTAWLQAAADLHGYCSLERHAVANAWASVGVGGAFNNHAICTNITGPSSVEYCPSFPFNNYTYTAQSFTGAQISWTVPSSLSYYTTGPNNRTLVITNVSAAFQGGTLIANANLNGQFSGLDYFYVGQTSCSFFRQASPERETPILQLLGNPVQDKVRMQLSGAQTSLQIVDLNGKVL